MPKLLTFRELGQRLKKHDKQFEIHNKGKGSHRAIYHPDINGCSKSCTIPFHGAGGEVKKCYYNQIKQRFDLPKDFFA